MGKIHGTYIALADTALNYIGITCNTVFRAAAVFDTHLLSAPTHLAAHTNHLSHIVSILAK